MSLRTLALTLFTLIASGFILVIGKDLLIQLTFALLFWFLIKGMRNAMVNIPGIGKFVPRWIWTSISIVFLFGVVVVVINLILSNLTSLESNTAVYTENARDFTTQIQDYIGMDINKYLPDFMESGYLQKLISQAAGMLSNGLSATFMVIIYAMFMFSEESNFSEKITNVIEDGTKREHIRSALGEIDSSTMNFLGLKTLIGLITGGASYIILYFMEIDAALFWAFLIFLFNYIPFVGSLIATLFPSIFAVFQFGDLYHPLMIFGLIEVVQILVGNVLEPRVMGKSLNLSSLVVIISLSFWSALWGIPGAFLSIPLTVVMVIIFKQFKSTIPIAKILSEKGTLEHE
jgi:AI-2 transport protein TqsA